MNIVCESLTTKAVWKGTVMLKYILCRTTPERPNPKCYWTMGLLKETNGSLLIEDWRSGNCVRNASTVTNSKCSKRSGTRECANRELFEPLTCLRVVPSGDN